MQNIFISDEGKDSLKQDLLILRDSLLWEKSSPVGNDVASGFPLCAVEEVVVKADSLSSAHQVWLQTSLLDLSLAAKIYSLIESTTG